MSGQELRSWFLLALTLRIIAAWTHASWHQPDEWFQTVEFGNLLANGFMTHSQEVELHLRNLSWPALLALPLWLARWLTPDWIHLRVFLVQLFTGLLDLAMLWGFWQCLSRFRLSRAWQHLALAIWILPWVMLNDSVRPSAEHLAAVATWVCLGLLARGRLGWAGFFCVMIAAMKYPAGLVSLGVAVSVLASEKSGRPRARFALGLAAGFLAGGAADWVVYGRPWESLWMYLQYNVASGASARAFGSQSVAVYFTFFRYRWFRSLLPLGLALAPAGAVGLARGLRRLEPWALGFAFYLIPHLVIAHKEGRFMAPIDGLWVFAAIPVLAEACSRAGARTRAWLRRLAVTTAVLNGVFLLGSLWGDTWKMNGTYFDQSWLRRSFAPDACAILTQRMPISVLYPWRDPRRVPEPALGYFDREQAAGSRVLAWAERAGPEASCRGPWLVHLERPDASWERERGCELLPSGVLSGLLARGWMRGPWYRCPPSVRAAFREELTERPLSHAIPRFATLPSGSEAVQLFTPRAPACRWLCY